jgi:hypothetical protein
MVTNGSSDTRTGIRGVASSQLPNSPLIVFGLVPLRDHSACLLAGFCVPSEREIPDSKIIFHGICDPARIYNNLTINSIKMVHPEGLEPPTF